MPTTSLDLDQIQGNSIGGFNKDFQMNLFLKFTSDAAGRAWIKEISEEVTASNSANVLQFNKSVFSAQSSRRQQTRGADFGGLGQSGPVLSRVDSAESQSSRSRRFSAGLSRRHGAA